MHVTRSANYVFVRERIIQQLMSQGLTKGQFHMLEYNINTNRKTESLLQKVAWSSKPGDTCRQPCCQQLLAL